jgi:hypothetical protein
VLFGFGHRIAFCVAVSAFALSGTTFAQSAKRDAISDLLQANAEAPKVRVLDGSPIAETKPDPRVGSRDYEQAKALMDAIDATLSEAADTRSGVSKLPSRKEFYLPPIWRETREERNGKVEALLSSALDIVTDVPVVSIQNKIDELRIKLRAFDDEIADLKAKQALLAPPKTSADADSERASFDERIAALTQASNSIKTEISQAKGQVAKALAASGISLDASQLDLLLDTVLANDLVRLIAAFNAAKLVDGQLAKMIVATGENAGTARKYFAMHAALFAMLVQAQDTMLKKIDTQYMPRLDAIAADLDAAQKRTGELLRSDNRPDQRRALEANRDSQKIAEDATKAYRRYLAEQRVQIGKARSKAVHDLRIADNTYETVEASVQLNAMMRESAQSFDALSKLQLPAFEQIFKNEELRREFENLTRRLDTPSS